MERIDVRCRVMLLGALLVGGATLGQTSNSVLTGIVVDTSTRAPVADVVVTATSPSLQGEQVVVTDASGLYRVPQLPPGAYTLRFEKETYRPYSRTGIEVQADRTLRLNVELLPEVAGSETVTVVGTPPVIDVGSSTVGTTVSQDFVRNLAVARPGGLGGANRSFDSLAAVAPTANNDTYGVAISGSQSPENSYLIDGLSVNDTAYGVNGTPLTIEFIDEVNVITGGYMPEYGRTLGGAVSAVTKSGGNEFHGSVWGTATPGGLAGAAAPTVAVGATQTIRGRKELGFIGDFGATLGGYIVKDKLWFFVGIQPSFTRYSYYRTFQKAQVDGSGNIIADPATGQPNYAPIENSEQRRFGDERSINFIAKLTYLLSSDNRLSLSVFGTPTWGGGNGSFPNRLPGGLQARNGLNNALYGIGTFNGVGAIKTNDSSYNVIGELNSSFADKRILLDVKLGWHHQLDEGVPADGSDFNTDNGSPTLAATPNYITHPGILKNVARLDQVPSSVTQACSGPFADAECGVLGYFTGGPGFIERLVLDSAQAKAVLTGLVSGLGHHVLKAGFDGTVSWYEHTKGYTGTVAYTEQPPGFVPVDYVQDGRRYGFLESPDVPKTFAYLRAKTRATAIGGFIQDSWSVLDKVTLNLGVRYDAIWLADANGKVGISLKDQWSPRVGVIWDPTQQGRSKVFFNYGRYYENIPLDIADRELTPEPLLIGFHDFNCNPLQNGRAACDAATFPISGSNPTRHWLLQGAHPVPVDPDLKSPANDEIVVGAEYEVLPNARLGVTYNYRNLVRTVEDMSNDEANTYFIGNPGEGIASTFPTAKRTYHAVTVQFTKAFSDLWLAQASYTWSQLRGNYDGLFRPQSFQLDPNLNSTFDLRSLLLNTDGPLAADATHNIKLYVAKEFPLGPVISLTVGLTFNATSGTPIDVLGAQAIYGPSEAYILPRGAGGRLPWVTALDAHLGLNYRVGKDSVLTLSVDGFNLFNSQRPTFTDNNYTFNTVGPIVNGVNGSLPSPIGAVIDPNRYDPSLSYEQNVAAGAVIRPANGNLPKPGYAAGGVVNTLLLDPNQQVTPVTVNPNWGKARTIQPVRVFRFGARFTF